MLFRFALIWLKLAVYSKILSRHIQILPFLGGETGSDHKKTKMKKLTCFLSAFFCLFLLVGQDAPSKKVSMEDYLSYETVSNPRLSPDGKQILFSRTWIDKINDSRPTDLWIMNADGSQARFFLEGSNGLWSPDGKRVAFTKEGEPKGPQIFVKFLGVEGEPTQITRLDKSPGNLAWSPDGQYIAFTMTVDDKSSWKINIPAPPPGAKWTEAPRIVDDLVYRRDRQGFIENGYTHIFVVPAEGGTARQITSGDWDHGGALAWTPDGKKIIFSSLRIPEAEYADQESNLYSVDVQSGAITQLTSRKGREAAPVVSPDGKLIAFIGTEWSENFYQKSMVYVCQIDGANPRALSADLDRNPSGLVWAGDNTGVYFNVEDQGGYNLHFSSLAGKTKPITKGNHVLTVTDILPGGQAVATQTSYNQPPDVVAFSLSNPTAIKRLTNVNRDILDFVKLGSTEEIRYKSTDGKEIQGWIVRPPDFDPAKKYPLILKIHGGPHSMYNVAFNFDNQLHAAAGNIVLYTNPRGSTGYGYEFANAIQNAYPGKDFDDLMSGVDAVIAKGSVDTTKMFVYGGSGGGVLTSWIVGHTNRFAAASVNYPVIDWLSFVGTTDGVGWYRNFKKYPWEDPSEHLARSPLMYVGNVKTPTMLMTGVKDLRTPISQTEEFYQALKVLKVPTVMIRFNEEFHGVSSKPSNYMRSLAYMMSWFEEWGNKKDRP